MHRSKRAALKVAKRKRAAAREHSEKSASRKWAWVAEKPVRPQSRHAQRWKMDFAQSAAARLTRSKATSLNWAAVRRVLERLTARRRADSTLTYSADWPAKS